MATLQESGYLYGAHSIGDIWGRPAYSSLPHDLNALLPTGNDTSAIPQLAEQPYRIDNTQGSGTNVQPPQSQIYWNINNNQKTLILFGAVVAVAVFWTRAQ